MIFLYIAEWIFIVIILYIIINEILFPMIDDKPLFPTFRLFKSFKKEIYLKCKLEEVNQESTNQFLEEQFQKESEKLNNKKRKKEENAKSIYAKSEEYETKNEYQI